jgi:hypothetical protein
VMIPRTRSTSKRPNRTAGIGLTSGSNSFP